MARKQLIMKNDILEAAFSMLREEGIEYVTARKLAARANCSTQPIFRAYRNMDELLTELYMKACDYFEEYYSSFPKQTVTPFVTLGHAYIHFAQEEPRIFSFLFLNKNRYGRSLYDLINGRDGKVSHEIQMASSQGCKNASDLFMKMWIFIHGAACMSLTGDYDLGDSETVQMLKDTYQSFR